MIAGLLGGMSVGAFSLDIPPQAYYARMHDTIELRHFLVGMSKAPIFAVVIGLIGCLEGLQVKGTAQSVGERTTSSVVQTISRSEERRVGKECVSTCRYRGSRCH